MDANEPYQSPDEPSMHAGSPFAEEPIVAEAAVVEPEEPRLSIMHLLVWTACVAVYFSFVRTIDLSGQGRLFVGTDVLSVFYGLGMGTGLAGLVLLGSRRLRGFPLAKHPGEYLLLLFGVSSVSSAVRYATVALIGPGDFKQPIWAQYVLMAISLGILVVHGLVLLMAVVRVKIPRWRVFFVIVIVTTVLQYVLPVILSMAGFFGIRFFVIGLPQFVGQISTIVLLVVAVMDLRERKRYPWQHWLGVGLKFWFSAFNVGGLVYYLVFSGMAS